MQIPDWQQPSVRARAKGANLLRYHEMKVSSLDQLFLSMRAIMVFETSTSSLVTGVVYVRRRRDMRCFWEQTGVLGPIYRLLAKGLNDAEIATKLGLTKVNVQDCIAWILHFLKLNNRQELVQYASARA